MIERQSDAATIANRKIIPGCCFWTGQVHLTRLVAHTPKPEQRRHVPPKNATRRMVPSLKSAAGAGLRVPLLPAAPSQKRGSFGFSRDYLALLWSSCDLPKTHNALDALLRVRLVVEG